MILFYFQLTQGEAAAPLQPRPRQRRTAGLDGGGPHPPPHGGQEVAPGLHLGRGWEHFF